jgi:hypothetical protein
MVGMSMAGSVAAPPPNPMTASWERHLNADYFTAEGKKSGMALPQKAEPEQVASARARVIDWAKSIGLVRVLDQYRTDDHEVHGQQQKVNDLREQMPNWEQRVLDRQKALDDVRSNGIPAAPERPHFTRFAAVGGVLGVLFGVIGASTLSSVLQSLWRTEAADPQTFYMIWGLGIGLLVGLVIGVATIATRDYAADAGAFVEWGSVVTGVFFAVGLAGYRFVQVGEAGNLEFHVSGLAIVLLCMEMGVLSAIEVNNLVALNAWRQFHSANREHQAWAARERAALAALDAETHVFNEAKQRLAREYGTLAQLEDEQRFYRHASENLDYFKDFAARAAEHGFVLGWQERQVQR